MFGLGSLPAGWLADLWGRRGMMIERVNQMCGRLIVLWHGFPVHGALRHTPGHQWRARRFGLIGYGA